jgi:hypothetical protein
MQYEQKQGIASGYQEIDNVPLFLIHAFYFIFPVIHKIKRDVKLSSSYQIFLPNDHYILSNFFFASSSPKWGYLQKIVKRKREV